MQLQKKGWYNLLILLFVMLQVQEVRSQLPQALWENSEDYTFMYYPKPLLDNDAFHILTNYHHVVFDFKTMNLREIKFSDQQSSWSEALKSQDKISDHEMAGDLLEFFVKYKGEEYRVVKGPKKLVNNELIESGRFFQRRYITNLVLEDGAPFVQLALEVSSWPDRINFRLENQYETDEKLSLGLRFKPNDFIGETKLQNDRVQLKDAQSNMDYSIQSSSGKVSWKRDEFSVENDSEYAEISIQSRQEILDNNVEIVAKEKDSPFRRISVDKDMARGSYVLKLNDNINGKEGIERISLSLNNVNDQAAIVRLVFDKTQVKGITGVSVMLRDKEGYPTGVPVQISKNWHVGPRKFSGPWFRGYTMLTIPAETELELEITCVNAFWGDLPAASHAQLSLVGWEKGGRGNKQLWEQSAVGAFGESICYEPDGGQAQSMITDVRPLFVQSIDDNVDKPAKWDWTSNVGGADFMRFFDGKGQRQFLASFKTYHLRNCPNLTEVIYSGETPGGEASFSLTSHLYRTDDYIRGTYQIDYVVKDTLEFDKLVVMQMGTDTYSYSKEKKFAIGNEKGLIQEWDTDWGGQLYRKRDLSVSGATPWVSMHEAVNTEPDDWGAWANKGMVVKSWKARVQGQLVDPHFSEYASTSRGIKSSLLELGMHSSIKKLYPGDTIQATLMMVVLPQKADSYYGPNEAFANILRNKADSWELVYREALENNVQLELSGAKQIRDFPPKLEVLDGYSATVELKAGLAFVPITLTGLKDYKDFSIEFISGDQTISIDQSVHGNDYWQVDFNPTNKTWEVTYSVPADFLGVP